jgi:lactoylglutathione lyase
MKFTMAHTNINVLNLERSLAFYQEALGLTPVRSYVHPEGEFTLVYIADAARNYQIELTCYRDRNEAYNHGDNDLHLAFMVDNFEEAHQRHTTMGCICHENKEMGIYFINDPDGYWLEVIPERG